MKRRCVYRAIETCVLAGAVLLPESALAADENLSFPVVLPERAGRSPPGSPASPRHEGCWWYEACAPGTCRDVYVRSVG